MVSSFLHCRAAHIGGPTSRASLLFQTDVSTLVLPSHYVKEEARNTAPYVPAKFWAAKFATNPHALRSAVSGKTRRDARLPGGLLACSCPDQVKPRGRASRSAEPVKKSPPSPGAEGKREAGRPGALHSNLKSARQEAALLPCDSRPSIDQTQA